MTEQLESNPTTYVGVERTGHAWWLRLAGEVDLASTEAVAEALETGPGAGGAPVVVDLAAVTFLDVAGARVVVDAVASLRRAGAVVTVEDPARRLQRVLTLTRTASAVRSAA